MSAAPNNSEKIDQILAKASLLTCAGVLFVARQPIEYQPGCGLGRPAYQHRVLLRHLKDTANDGSWTLPTHVDVAANIVFDDPVPFGDFLLAKVAAEFEPALGGDKYEWEWRQEDLAKGHPWTHPTAAKGVNQFIETFHDSLPRIGDQKMMEPRAVFVEIQSRAQRAYGDAGAPAPMQGECSHDYECRLAKPHQRRSKEYRDTDLDKVRDPIVRARVADSIYQDSANYVEPGQLRRVPVRDASGREIVHYEGDPNACWDQFNPPVRHVRRFCTRGQV